MIPNNLIEMLIEYQQENGILLKTSGKLRLDPEIVGYELKNFGMNPEVIEEIKQCIYEKNHLDDFKKEKGIYDTWEDSGFN